jgi:hypothetical protein
MEIKVSRDFPIPAENAEEKRIGAKKYPWDDMGVVGASFPFPPDVELKTARSVASKRQRVDRRTYLVRRDVEGTGEVRCWTTALELPPGMKP